MNVNVSGMLASARFITESAAHSTFDVIANPRYAL